MAKFVDFTSVILIFHSFLREKKSAFYGRWKICCFVLSFCDFYCCLSPLRLPAKNLTKTVGCNLREHAPSQDLGYALSVAPVSVAIKFGTGSNADFTTWIILLNLISCGLGSWYCEALTGRGDVKSGGEGEGGRKQQTQEVLRFLF